MDAISIEATKQLFTEARTYSAWSKKDVSEETLRKIYELVKFGPTSANSCPARFVFVKADSEKEKLISTLIPANVDKVRAAPVTAIVAMDEKFYEKIPKLYPPAPAYREVFSSNRELAESTSFRNSSLQGAYFIIAARAQGLDCGPMSGFDNKKLDEAFFSGTSWKSNFICNVGYGDKTKLFPRLPRLTFEEACRIV